MNLYLAFVLTGVATTMLGPLLPALQARWQIGDARGGLLFTAQFLASVAASALVGPLAARFGYSRVIAAGLLLMALGAGGLSVAPWPAGLLAVTAIGAGLGLTIASSNLKVASRGNARSVMLLNALWCAGAVLAPALVALLGGAFLTSLAAALLVFAAAMATEPALAASAKSAPRSTVRDGATVAALLFLYVGTESATAGWVASLAARSPETSGYWALFPSVFWAAMLAGRMAGPLLLLRLRPHSLLMAAIACAFAGVAILLAGRAGWSLAAGAISGFGLAPVFPLVVSEYAERSGGRVSGLIFSAGGLGGAALPAAVGYLSQTTGSLRGAMTLVLFAVAGIAWLQSLIAPARTPRSGWPSRPFRRAR